MTRAIACLLLLVGGCTCEAAGCNPDVDEEEPPPVATEPPLEGDDGDEATGNEGEDGEEGDRFQVFQYDLAAYGAARGTWSSVEIDGSRIERIAERGEGGDGRVIATRDGEQVAAIHVVDGVVYTVRHGRCRAAAGAMADAMRKVPGMVPLNGVAVTVYGVLGDGVPENAAEPLDADAPGELPVEGVRFRSEHDTALYDVTIAGTAWRDDQDRPVRSQGELDLRPRVGEEPPAEAEWSFAIEKIDEPSVDIPDACTDDAEQVAAMEELPRLEGHETVAKTAGNLVYRAPGNVQTALELYRQDLTDKGWNLAREGQNERTGTFMFQREGERMTVIATKKDDEVTVVISHVR